MESGGGDVATVTALTRRDRRRVEFALDDGSSLALGADLAAERRLAPGMPLSGAERRALEAEDARRTALTAALRLLARGPRSERDLRDRLRRRGMARDAIDSALARLRELGYVDDAAFARAWVETHQDATPRSRRVLRFELSRKGVERALADAATAGVSDEDAAYEAARRRLGRLQGLDRPAFERRLGAFLSGRGFGYGVARAVIARCWGEVAGQAGVGTRLP